MNHVQEIAKQLGLEVGEFKGSGIHMNQQPFVKSPKKGDYVWDGDWGYLMWTGTDWHLFEGAPKPITL